MEITRLIKRKMIHYVFWARWLTRKDRRKKIPPVFSMEYWAKKVRKIENRKFRRDKFNTSNHKKYGVAYRRITDRW